MTTDLNRRVAVPLVEWLVVISLIAMRVDLPLPVVQKTVPTENLALRDRLPDRIAVTPRERHLR